MTETSPTSPTESFRQSLHEVQLERHHGVVPSAEQLAIYEWFRSGTGNLDVEAFAGTGKTFTLVEGITHAPEARILVAAFNKRIQEELVRKLRNPNAEAKTLHGVGYACVRRFWERIGVASGSSREWALAQEVCGDGMPDAIKRLVGKACTKGREIVPLAQAPEDLLPLLVQFELEPDDEWQEAGYGSDLVAAKALEAMDLAATHKPREIDYADMLYLPVRNKWLVKTYDMVVIDERQDMSATQLRLALGVCKGRIVTVGDPNQAIYGFRGADVRNYDALTVELKATRLKLPTTYRCPRVVVDYAATLVPGYQAAPSAPEGRISSLPTLEALVNAAEPIVDQDGKPHDFVLSRTNAPLARVAMACIRAGKRVRIQGRDIGAGLIALVDKIAKGKAADSLDRFLERVVSWRDKECERARAKDREDLVDAILDKAETLMVVADGATGVRDVKSRLQDLFSDDGAPATIVCSSVHKAKGLEARRVFVLRPTLYPKAFRKPGAPVPPAEVLRQRAIEERNIEYVAVTRAQDELVWIEAK